MLKQKNLKCTNKIAPDLLKVTRKKLIEIFGGWLQGSCTLQTITKTFLKNKEMGIQLGNI